LGAAAHEGFKAMMAGSCSQLLLRLTSGVVCLVLAVGCSQDRQVAGIVAAKNDSNLKRLANLYQSYQLRHSSQGPKDEAAFKGYIQYDMPAHRLEMMQIDPNNLDALFVSERDGQPFRVRYGVGGGAGWVVAVVFEQQGVGGEKQVGFTDGTVESADENRYRQLLEDRGRSNLQKTAANGSGAASS
jgi:hypothetical protein